MARSPKTMIQGHGRCPLPGASEWKSGTSCEHTRRKTSRARCPSASSKPCGTTATALRGTPAGSTSMELDYNSYPSSLRGSIRHWRLLPESKHITATVSARSLTSVSDVSVSGPPCVRDAAGITFRMEQFMQQAAHVQGGLFLPNLALKQYKTQPCTASRRSNSENIRRGLCQQ